MFRLTARFADPPFPSLMQLGFSQGFFAVLNPIDSVVQYVTPSPVRGADWGVVAPQQLRAVLEAGKGLPGLVTEPARAELTRLASLPLINPHLLYSYQARGAQWLRERRAALLGSDMGTGKTLMALRALNGEPTVIVCPSSVIINWQREIVTWAPQYRVTTDFSTFKWSKETILVCSSAQIKKLTKVGPGAALIVDEYHQFKNWSSARTKAMRTLMRTILRLGGHAWGLTATPILKNPNDLWILLQHLDLGSTVYGDREHFNRAFGVSFNPSGGHLPVDVEKISATATLPLRPYILRHTKAEVLPQLPGKMRCHIHVAAKYTKDQDVGVGVPDEGLSLDSGVLHTRQELARAKIPALLQLVEEHEAAGEPLVVFCCHRAPIEALQLREGWGVVWGGQTPEQRQRVIDDFQGGKLRGVALTVQAGGIGLTLTRAANVVFVDQDFTPPLNLQAEDRCCRIGQTRPVTIRIMVADHPLDRRLSEIIDTKLKLLSATVEKVVDGADGLIDWKSIYDDFVGCS